MFRTLYRYFLIKRSNLFDKNYYLNRNPDIDQAKLNPLWHFIHEGCQEERNPSHLFDIQYYINSNPEVKRKGINPLIHYIKDGKREGRKPLPTQSLYKMDKTSLSIKQQSIIIPKNHSGGVSLYLHIGQNKTGTSAIQKFMDINRLKLFREYGYLYPNFFANNYLSGVCNNHTSWYKSVKDNREKFIDDLNNLISFAIKNDISKIVLSSEAWFLRNEVIRNFEYLIDQFDFIKIKPICYLRRIDLWIESAWKQWGLKEYDSFEDFYDQPRYYQMYQNALAHLNSWGEIIPIKNIIVRPYEKQQLPGGLLNDFLKIIGIDYKSNNWNQIKNDNLSVNRGFNRDVLEILHYCRELYTNVHDNRYFDLFSDLLGDEFQKKPFEPYELLSPQQRWKLFSNNFPFEQEIAEKFMERKDGKIFYDSLPNPDDPWEPYEGLTLEKAIPIIIKLINENNRKLSAVQRKFNKINQ